MSKHEAKGHSLVLIVTCIYQNFHIGIINSVSKATQTSVSEVIKPLTIRKVQSKTVEPCMVPGTYLSLN